MMEKINISQFKLELYQLDLASPKERKQVEAALSSDEELRRRYEAIVESDQEIRRRYPYPPEKMPVPAAFRDVRKPGFERNALVRGRLSERKLLLAGLGAAAVLVCVFFFSILSIRNQSKREALAARGTENHINDFSISIYPGKTQALLSGTEYEDGLPNGTLLSEGDSLLVAYTTPQEGEYEGVIFAVNGKPGSDVTLLFPAGMGDRPILSNGGEPLNGEYKLKSAQDFVMFFLVASQNSMNAETIIRIANEAIAEDISAGESGRNPETVKEKINSAFQGYEVRHSYINVTN